MQSATLPDSEGGHMMHWALSGAWRTVGTSAYPEGMTHADPNNWVFGGQSNDLAWDSRQFVTGPENGRVQAWYPTRIDGGGGDAIDGATVHLYCADIDSDVNVRDFVYKTITLSRNG